MTTAIVSSTGQITIPLNVRKEHGLDKETKVNIQSNQYGITIIKVPSNPLSKLRGILKDVSTPSKNIKHMREEDDKTRESKILKISKT